MPRDRRVDRRIKRPIAGADPVMSMGAVGFGNNWGTAVQSFDPATLGLPADMVVPLMAAFRTNDAGSSPRTRAARWRALRRFAGFLAGEGDNRVLMRNRPEEIRAMVESMTETGRLSRGYMMCIGNHIPWNVPGEAVKRYLDLSAELAYRG